MEKEWSSLSHLRLEENPSTKYFMAQRSTVLSRVHGKCERNIGQMDAGMLVQWLGVESKDLFRVRLHCKTKDEIWYETVWRCHPIDLIPVPEIIWHMLCPISSLQERLRLVKNKPLCKDVQELKLNSKVWYCSESDNPEPCSATVKYIGPVRELGDGYYFGLELSEDPETAQPPFLTKYFQTLTLRGVFATLSNINPRKPDALEPISNFEKNFLLSNDMLQPKKTDNFFINKNKEITDSKRNINVLQHNTHSRIINTDNNNQAIGPMEPITFNVTNYPAKKPLHEEKVANKILYKEIKSFDPLISDDKTDEPLKTVQQPTNSSNLSIGSCVEVLVDNDTHYGVIRWIGTPEGSRSEKVMAAIELDNVHPLATDGTYQKHRYFECSPKKAWFTDLKDCHRYDMAASSCYYTPEIEDFASIKSSVIVGAVPPISVKGDLNKIFRKYRGIQGHHNSCYLDATLFSMFAFTSVFDCLLFRPANKDDCPEYTEVQRVLREEIVNPLRKDLFVGANHVMKLRTLLEKVSSVSGLTSEEKDPEEFLTSLVAQTLKAEPFLKLSSGQDTYHYQLFVEKDEQLVLPTVQQLLEQSFLTSNIRLKEVPSCLIIQMPRFGKSYKMYPKIQPTLLLDVTDIIEDSPRQCTVCGKLAKFECKECYGQCGEGLESIAFCKECLEKAHCHEMRNNHKPKDLTVPNEYEILKEHCQVPRLYLELLAVVCIETSHYVSFVKCAPGSEAPWCFFDSMADRKGEQDGYNIPEMVPCQNFPYWLSEEGAKELATMTDDRSLPEHAKRLLCDAYMCMYQSPDVMMYK